MNSVVEKLMGTAAGALDSAVLSALRHARTPSTLPSLSKLSLGTVALPTNDNVSLALDRARRTYGMPGTGGLRGPSSLDAPLSDSFFPRPSTPAPRLERDRDWGDGGSVVDASWASEATPFCPSMQSWVDSHPRNRTARARLYLGRSPRPAVVLLHGFNAGQWRVEETVWPLAWFDRSGIDAAIAVLPHHAVRSDAAFGPPPWPSGDASVTCETFRQAISDIRALIAFLRARGATSVGVMGVSLGAYTASLLATLDADLAFCVALTPLASISDIARAHPALFAGLVAGEAQLRAYNEATYVTSPLARPCLLAKERTLVLAADSNRITPRAHAEKLSAHLGGGLETFVGSHLLPVGLGDAYRHVGRMLGRIGFFPNARN